MGLFVVCCSLLISEILLTRVFSVCLWYHFAFFVISVAMFGLGLGGLCVQLFPTWFKKNKLSEQLSTLTLILALTAIIAPLLLFKINIPANILRTFEVKTTLILSVAFLLSSLPFFFGGLVTSLLFREYSKDISKIYFADLGGASIGCFLAIPLLNIFGAPTAILLNAIIACTGSIFFVHSSGFRKVKSKVVVRPYVVIFCVAIITLLSMTTALFDLEYAKGIDKSEDEFSKWNSISRVAVTKVLDANAAHWIGENIWGVSRKFEGKYPDIRIIDIDADAGTFLTNFKNDFDLVSYVKYDPPSIVHRLRKESKTLVIGAGGGKDVLAALSFGAKHVTAVELNPIIVNNVMLDKYSKFSGGLYKHPRVKAVAAEGRSFVASSKEKYNIIQMAYVDTSAATAGGAYVLAENNLYTTESVKLCLEHLYDNGIFSVCWVDVPGLAGATRLVSLGIAALEELGIEDASKNIIVVSHASRPGWVIRDVLLKKKPFSQYEQKLIIDTCRDLGFELTYIPMKDNRDFAVSDIHNDKDLIRVLINNKNGRHRIHNSLPVNIRPTTDDKPFFFYQNQPKDFFKTLKMSTAASYIIYTAGTIVLSRVLIIGLVMVGFFYLMPLIFSAWDKRVLPCRKSSLISFLCYFSCIGMGFMFLEIVFLQKLLLFLGHPSYTLSVTLLSLFLFAGLGSLYTQRLTTHLPRVYIRRIILVLVMITLAYLIRLKPIFYLFLGYPKATKLFVAVVVLMFPSFLMGMPFPLATKELCTNMNEVMPWMWGINGATSVLASIAAIILAMNVGYNFTLIIGILCYIVALIFSQFWPKQA